MPTAFERRTRECQRRMAADGLVLCPGPNQYYLSGFHGDASERPLLLFVPAAGDPVFLAPRLSADRIRDASWVANVRDYADEDDPAALVSYLARDLGVSGGRLLVDPGMQARITHLLRDALPTATWGLADEVLADRRVRKDEAELDAMRRAAAVADDAAREMRALGADAVGRTERSLARELERRLADAGSESLPFEVIVAAGPNGARPHHRHGDRRVEPGDPVVLDFGATVDHYPSDQTRTVVFGGDPPDGFVDAFEAVRAAQEAAVDAVEPGVAAGDVDAAARSVLDERGYGDAFVHRTGHGVGLEVHEEPYLVAGNDRSLEAGMVFSVEPGVYLEGDFGVRVEDLVLVTESGCERLTDSPRGWQAGGA